MYQKNRLFFSTFVLMCLPTLGHAMTYGVNYNWSEGGLTTCPEILKAFLPNYAAYRTQVQTQLKIMKANGVDSIRLFIGWGDDYGAAASGAFVGPLIAPPQKILPSSYFDNVNLFVSDAGAAGIGEVILSLGGAGSYDPGSCTNDLTGLVIPTYEAALDQLMSKVVRSSGASKPRLRIDLQNEVAPSNYEPTCAITSRTSFIKTIWSYYVDHYGTATEASFSAILDDSANFEIAGNRLNNLITALRATGKRMPSYFEVHTYGSRSAVINQLRGVYQIYSDFGFLSNGTNPKETIIGETFYEDSDTATGMNDYLTSYDGYKGGRIGLSTILSWPLAQPIGCVHAVNVLPPYKATVYKNIITDHLATIPSVSASPNPVPLAKTGLGTTTVSWNAPGYGWVSLLLLVDGVLKGGFAGGGTLGSQDASWIQSGHSYTFQIFPALPPDGHADPAHLLNSVTVISKP